MILQVLYVLLCSMMVMMGVDATGSRVVVDDQREAAQPSVLGIEPAPDWRKGDEKGGFEKLISPRTSGIILGVCMIQQIDLAGVGDGAEDEEAMDGVEVGD